MLAHRGGDQAAFPSYHTPVNGTRTWTLDWSGTELGPVGLSIDGQPMTASGTWDPYACGAFTLDASGTYTGPTDSSHTFEARIEGVVWGERTDGRITWTEDWVAWDRVITGTFEADARFEAERDGAGE